VAFFNNILFKILIRKKIDFSV